MLTQPEYSASQFLDLAAPPPLVRASFRLQNLRPDHDARSVLKSLTDEDRSVERTYRLGEVLRKLDNEDIATLLITAGQASLNYEERGLRFLFDFLQVKRPGVEVLRQLETLTSLERIALRIVAGSWKEPEESADANSVFPILDVLEEATHVGVLDLGIEKLPRQAKPIRALLAHLRGWFASMRGTLEREQRVSDPFLNLLTQLGMVEISFLEKRLSHLASSIDPYDVMGMGRLMPVLSRYDQDVEHMKSVVSRLVTYEPFDERMMTMEHVLSINEMQKIVRSLSARTGAAGIERILSTMRNYPMLDREFIFMTSLIHQTATLRAQHLGEAIPDLHSVVLQVLVAGIRDSALFLRMESDVVDEIWPVMETWGALRRADDSLEVRFREDRAMEFILPDGSPRLPEYPEERKETQLSIKELVRLQMNSDPFVMGILDNPKASGVPGVVPLIAAQSRSLRVLDKICRTKSLHTGTANKDVPRLILMNPARVPVNQIRRFVHVRFVSKTDLKRLSGRGVDVRPEVRKEVATYLGALDRGGR